MVRYGNYAPPRTMVLNEFEQIYFRDAWHDTAGKHPLGEMWRDVVAAGIFHGVGMSEMVGLIPAVFDEPDDRSPFAAWDLFCTRVWERSYHLPVGVAA